MSVAMGIPLRNGVLRLWEMLQVWLGRISSKNTDDCNMASVDSHKFLMEEQLVLRRTKASLRKR